MTSHQEICEQLKNNPQLREEYLKQQQQPPKRRESDSAIETAILQERIAQAERETERARTLRDAYLSESNQRKKEIERLTQQLQEKDFELAVAQQQIAELTERKVNPPQPEVKKTRSAKTESAAAQPAPKVAPAKRVTRATTKVSK